jgi:hypothetical protein
MPEVLQLLIAERDKLNRAIAALQGTGRRGGPPKVAGGVDAPTPVKRKRRGMSAAARKRQSERMKAYWAARRAQRKAKK